MRNRPAFKLNLPFMIHNFYLTSISAILLALFIEQLVPTVYNHGIFYAICDVKGGWTPPLVILYYVCAIGVGRWHTSIADFALAELPHEIPRVD